MIFTRNILMSIPDKLARLNVLVMQTQAAYDVARGTNYFADIQSKCLPMLDKFAGMVGSVMEAFTKAHTGSEGLQVITCPRRESVHQAAGRGGVSLLAEMLFLFYPHRAESAPLVQSVRRSVVVNPVAPLRGDDSVCLAQAMIAAARAGRTEVAALLMRHLHRDDTWQHVSRGKVALVGAGQNGHLETVRALLRDGMLAENVSDDALARFPSNCRAAVAGYPAVAAGLVAAVLTDRPDKVKAALARPGAQAGAVEAPRDGGRCAVVVASERGCLPVLRVLLEAPGPGAASACDCDRRGVTPLMAAAGAGHRAVVEALLGELGALPSLHFREFEAGKTALGLARDKEIAERLRRGSAPATCGEGGCAIM